MFYLHYVPQTINVFHEMTLKYYSLAQLFMKQMCYSNGNEKAGFFKASLYQETWKRGI